MFYAFGVQFLRPPSRCGSERELQKGWYCAPGQEATRGLLGSCSCRDLGGAGSWNNRTQILVPGLVQAERANRVSQE